MFFKVNCLFVVDVSYFQLDVFDLDVVENEIKLQVHVEIIDLIMYKNKN